MRPLPSHAARLLAAGLLAASFGLAGCKSTALVIDPPQITPGASGSPVRVGDVVDARVFTTQSTAAPMPSTRGDAHDPEWTRRVFGRRRTGMRTLGGDRFTLDARGVPALVEAALAAGLTRADHPVTVRYEAAPEAHRLDVVIEAFWIREAMQSTAARLGYHAEIVASGPLAGFEEPVRLRAQGSVLSGAADGVAWRNTVRRTLDDLAAAMAEAVAAGEAGDTESRWTAP